MTAKEYIEKNMPEPYLSAALENIKKYPLNPDREVDSIRQALKVAFNWGKTIQRGQFWYDCSCEKDFSKWPELPAQESATSADDARLEAEGKDPKSRYYDAGGIEVLDVIAAKLTPEQFKGYLLGNVIKYALRANHKGCWIRDVEKMATYSKRLKLLIDANHENGGE